jgi:Icc-related predicted phosphoesterase
VRVAALYDVHGNLPAFEAVLSDPRCEAADLIVSGGDLVAGPFPAECLDLLVSLGERSLRGGVTADEVTAEFERRRRGA